MKKQSSNSAARKTTALAASAFLAGFFTTGAALAQQNFDSVEIKSTKVLDGLYMLEGAGGNLGLSVGEDGSFLIDDQFAPLTTKISAAAKAIDDKPIEFVLNTHWHGDHTGGNENLGKAGAHIVAHENVRKRLQEGLKTETRNTPPAPADALPVITFNDQLAFYWNGMEIAVYHPDPAHTDGDALVFFNGAEAVHMGDVFFNGFFAYIDLDSGGDLDGAIAAQEWVLSRINDDTKIIPGHGPLATKADLQKTVDMLKDVRMRIQKLVDDGKSEDEAVAANPLADYADDWSNSFMNAERMVRIAYKSLSKSE